MDYDLVRLGPREFEHLTQALCVKAFGARVQIFGDGPDGGRDATVQGPIHWGGEVDGGPAERWDGNTVVQVKFRQRPGDPAANLKWLLDEVRGEIFEWTRARRRTFKPDYMLIATNVVLSPGAGAGIDSALEAISEALHKSGLQLRGWRLWHYDTFCTLLDAHRSVRVTYGGFLTSGDVLAKINEWLERTHDRLGEPLTAHAIKDMLAQQYVRLGQAGESNDDKLALHDIGIDLPANVTVTGRHGRVNRDVMAAEHIIQQGERVIDLTVQPEAPPHILVLGGPGQGKSTLTQMVCQAYRVALLGNTPLHPEARRLLGRLREHFEKIALPTPKNLRWPVRVVLSDYGDKLAANPSHSLMRYLAEKISSAGAYDITGKDLREWLISWPWLLVLDGMDEVVSPTVRERVSTGIRDFLVEAALAKADVLLVITTRPQGYLGEFGSEDYHRLLLRDLEPREALFYAHKLTELRLGDDPDLEQQVDARLTESTKTVETSRLMRTPLQVTIMTLLLERRQRVPSNRYQLFHAYFDTIYAREANKPTELGRFLEDYRSDIEAIHESVALELQQQAETLIEHEGSLLATDLGQHAYDRLRREGNDDDKARELARQVVTAATHRLVLLVPHGDNGVGFEVRSLQEYLAARALTRGEGAEVLELLRPLTPSAHWRNTWLLAAGRLFIDREGLREQLISLLREFDNQNLLTWLVRAGAELATDLLADDLAIKSPQYRRLLADHTLERLTGLPDGSVHHLAEVLSRLAEEDPLIRQKVKERLASLLAIEGGSRAHALMVLQDFADNSNSLRLWAQPLLADVHYDEELGIALLSGASLQVLPKAPRSGPKLMKYLLQYLPELAEPDRTAMMRLFSALPDINLRAVSREGSGVPQLLLAKANRVTDHALLEETLSRPAVAEAYAYLVKSLPPQHWHVATYLRDIARTWYARRAASRVESDQTR